MNNTMIVFAMLLVGCSTETPSNIIMSDAGFAGDGGVVSDAMEVSDAQVDGGSDAAELADAGTSDVGADGGSVGDHDGGTDAASGSPDSGASTSDAGVDAAVARGDVVELGVSGYGTCVLTSTHQMWCWGGAMRPTHVADAVALEGNCAIGLDGHVFCIGIDFPGTDAVVVSSSSGTYVRRADGVLVAGTATWSPPSAIEALPALNCGLLSDGTARCWDQVFVGTTSMFANFVNLGMADDVARASAATCVHAAAGVHCNTARGTTGSALLQRGAEVDIAGGRACAVVSSSWSGLDDAGGSGFHDSGVYCTSDTPLAVSTGYYPFNPLPAADPVGTYTNIVGTDLRVGTSHACLLRSGQVMCWGDGTHGQLGGMTTTHTPVVVF